MKPIIAEIEKIGIVPVVVLKDAEKAVPLAKALCEGGIPCAEVTFRTDAAEESIRLMAEACPEMLIGAGTVLTTGQAARAVKAGAKFIVSPGFDLEIVNYCIERNIPVLPGVATPTEAAMAVKAGLEVVKFFPAEAAGGLKMLKAMAAPYTMLRFMPTGGIDPKNIRDYLGFDRIVACGGSWMVQGSLIDSGEFDKIKQLTKEAAELVKEIRG